MDQNKVEEQIFNLESQERKEKNVTKHTITIKEMKINFEKLKPKNQSGKFLTQEKFDNEDSKRSIQNIINNFLETESIIEKYIKEFESEEKKKFFEKERFILTKDSKERLALLIHYILNGIQVLFEGNTGTSKTRTVLTACKYIKTFYNEEMELTRYNLSAETKIDDILAKYVSKKNSFVGLEVQNGPFLDAYENGKIILFDEINLAQPNVLQCIQQSLDNGFISVEINGNCLLKKKKDINFALVATQNPNKGSFAGKRQELGPEFLSRFQKINFPDISKEEMEKIALGIAKNVKYLRSDDEDKKNKKKLIKNIVNLHYEWAKETDSQDNIQCFTIREIESVIECLKNKEDLYDTILTIYGGRFRQKGKASLVPSQSDSSEEPTKEKLKSKLEKYKIKKELNGRNESLPKNFPKCFINDNLVQTVNSVLLSLRNKRNVIIVGNYESGLTQVAEWCSQYYNEENGNFEKEEKERKIKHIPNICFCTKNLECSDLITYFYVN